jgi:hypothetical protein
MLREARIVMPHGDTAASIMAHNTLRRQLAKAFGGFTCFRGEGGWVDGNGNLIRDNVMIYDIAMDNHRDAPFELLHRIAIDAGRALDQDSVYIRYPNGEVHIEKIEKRDFTVEAHKAYVAGKRDLGATLDRDAVFLDTLRDIFGKENVLVIGDDMGDGRSAGLMHNGVDKELPMPGQLWKNRAGEMVFVGKRATVVDGGWYATETRTGFEYIVDHDGQVVPHVDGPAMRDLVEQV